MRPMPWGSARLCKELCYSASAVRIYTAFAHSVPEELEYVQVYPNSRALVGSTREHHPELVLRQQQGHAHTQLPLPRGRRGSGPHQQAQGEAESQVSTALPCQSACRAWQANASRACVGHSLTSTTLAGEGSLLQRNDGPRRMCAAVGSPSCTSLSEVLHATVCGTGMSCRMW